MTSRFIWIVIGASMLSFAAGFFVANTLNRRELSLEQPKSASLATVQNSNSKGSTELTLTTVEIQSKIAEADANPSDFKFQKNLGMSLYRYAAMKQDSNLLPEALRIMERALAIQPADRDLQIGVGNAYFDKGYFNKDNESLAKSRDFYREALVRMPTDTDVRADLALTYFLYEPPDLAMAVTEFEKGLEANPKHERALQFLTQTYIKQNDAMKAAATLEMLKLANSSNTAIAELSTSLAGISQGSSK